MPLVRKSSSLSAKLFAIKQVDVNKQIIAFKQLAINKQIIFILIK